MPSHKTATVLFSLLLATAACAVAEVTPIEEGTAPEEFATMDFCKDFSIIAREIMIARQKDKPMSETLPMAIGLFSDMLDRFGIELDEEINLADEAVAELVMGAYEVPVWGVDSLSRTAISDFENGAFGACFKMYIADSEE